MEEIKTDAIVTEESSTSEEEQKPTVPLERFNEVYGKMKSYEEQIKAVSQDINALKQKGRDEGLNETEKQELEAKNYLKNLIQETQKEIHESEKSAKEQELANFAKQVDDALIDSGVKKSDFLDFLEKDADEYEFGSVKAAMNFYKKHKLTEEKEPKEKPSLPNSDASPGGKQTYDDTGKSLRQVLNELTKSH
jgi:regulator of replication initiation timing